VKRCRANGLKHIITIHDVGQDGEQLFIAMEYLPGRTLTELLEAEGALSLQRALPILEQIADALDYAHEEGVIHRDVKPSNVMVEEDRRGMVRVTLTDFGLVKALETSEALTSVGTILGSPEYMAPEQADPARRDEIGPGDGPLRAGRGGLPHAHRESAFSRLDASDLTRPSL